MCTQAREEGSPTLCKESGISSLSLGTQRLHSSLLGSSISVPRALAGSGGQSRAALHKPFVGLGAALRASLPSAEGWNPVWSIFVWSFCSSFDRQSLNNNMEYSNYILKTTQRWIQLQQSAILLKNWGFSADFPHVTLQIFTAVFV